MDSQEVEEHLDRVYKRAVQRINIPGFRKGKAPRSVLERELGKDAMLDDALDTLIPQITARAIEQESLEVISTPKANVSTYEPLTIEVIVPVKPNINLGDYLDYRLSQEPVEVSEDQIDEVVESIRRDSSTWSPIKRPVELDDMVTIQVKGTMDDTVIIDDQGVEYVVSSESTNPMPGFADQILGMKIGSTKEFTLKFPSDYAQPGLPGKECHFSVFMDEIKKRQLPSVNNNFAKSLSLDVKTVKSLRKKLGEDILSRNQSISDQGYQDQIIKALVAKANPEIPPLLIDHEVEHIISEQAESMEKQQLKMEDYLNSVGKSILEIQAEVRPSAEERIIRTLVLEKFRENESIEVTDEDIEQELESMLKGATTDSESSMRTIFDNENGRASIRNMLTGKKTLERLTQIAKGESDNTKPSSKKSGKLKTNRNKKDDN